MFTLTANLRNSNSISWIIIYFSFYNNKQFYFMNFLLAVIVKDLVFILRGLPIAKLKFLAETKSYDVEWREGNIFTGSLFDFF